MQCPLCGSHLVSPLSCQCNEFDCVDRFVQLFECNECQQVFNVRV